jgi:hypothetical protein
MRGLEGRPSGSSGVKLNGDTEGEGSGDGGDDSDGGGVLKGGYGFWAFW